MLDDIEYIKKIDRSRMIELLMKFPDDIKSAVENARSLDLELFYPDMKAEDISAVVVSGMGGSGISGDIVRDVLFEDLHVPIIVNKKARLPAFAGEGTLLIVVSYSGNTEETLSVFREGLKRGVRMVAITSGGVLDEEARKNEVPVIRVPTGCPPRAALPHLLFSVYITLERAGLIEVFDPTKLMKSLKRLINQLYPEMGVARNIAKQTALKIKSHTPHIYIYEKYAAAADRWRTQLNENSKMLAHTGLFSEMNHNDIVGWTDTDLKGLAAVLLRTEDETPTILKRMEFTSHIFKRKGRLIEVYAEGESIMEKMLSLILIGDFTSVYLAVLREIDPTPVDIIEELKKTLKA